MVVVITNITDVPGELAVNPQDVDVWNKRLSPGSTMNLPAKLVDKRVRKLEAQGLVAVGAVPPWYLRAKMKGSVRTLSEEEKAKRLVTPSSAPKPKTSSKPEPKLQAVPVLDDVVPYDNIKEELSDTVALKKQKR